MLLRSIIEHVKAQNWTAVVLDFVIVVVGVFMGIQVSNLNDAGRERLSEAHYLERFADEIELTITHIREERTFAETALGVVEKFTTQIYRDSASDEQVLSAAEEFLSTGAFFVNFRPIRTTFDDLVSTGNLEIIKNEDIRTGLIRLHARYEEAQNTIESNIVWIQQGEDRIYYNFDAFRFDARTGILFDDITSERLADDIRKNRELLRRHAAFHYWLKVRSVELYEDVEPQAQAVLDLIKAERGE